MRLLKSPMLTVAAILAVAGLPFLTAHAEKAVLIPPPAQDAKADGTQTAVLAGGCFWGVQAVFQHTKGVTRAVSGYAGGTKETANYNVVSSGGTAHAEAVQVTFDPRVVSYGQILQIFFSVAHDPTQLNRQGPDKGPQYRSEIFPQTDEQRQVAKAYIAQLDAAKAYPRPIATKVSDGKAAFYAAEAYHQDYATKNPMQPYIVINDAPKVKNLEAMFAQQFRATPVLVGSLASN